MKKLPFICVVGLVVSLAGAPAPADLPNTRHNLSVTGPGPLKAKSEQRICVFCHTPHSARAQSPLWNRRDAGRVYVRYWSPTLDAYRPGSAPPVNGSTRLCMSCHDGTVALGKVLQGGPIRMRPGAEHVGRGSGRVDLSGSHPVSFRVTPALVLKNNARDTPLRSVTAMRTDPDVHLDAHDRMQCTTCHDPHKNRYEHSSGVPFYRKPTWGAVCTVCHRY